MSVPAGASGGVPPQSEPTERFAFGKNWQRFLRGLDEDRVARAEAALCKMLGRDSLEGMSFLDIGSGSGLSSLAAKRLGASEVFSFDYDADSVACTEELKRRFFTDSDQWIVQQGDCTDPDFMSGLGRYDIVYSWGVLHHTGAMWDALALAVEAVKPGGLLHLAIYNDQGWLSRFWWRVKRAYCAGPVRRAMVLVLFIPLLIGMGLLSDLLNRRNPLDRYRKVGRRRGMSIYWDWVDWLGGYPFEVAKPEQIHCFCYQRGFSLLKMRTCGGGSGCNDYVFRRLESSDSALS